MYSLLSLFSLGSFIFETRSCVKKALTVLPTRNGDGSMVLSNRGYILVLIPSDSTVLETLFRLCREVSRCLLRSITLGDDIELFMDQSDEIVFFQGNLEKRKDQLPWERLGGTKGLVLVASIHMVCEADIKVPPPVADI